MKKIDATGLACPLPVIQTKKALVSEEQVQTIVDNQIATQNLKKLADQLGYTYQVVKEAEDKYIVLITKNGSTESFTEINSDNENEAPSSLGYAVVIEGNKMGKGAEALGENLMKAFIYSLTEQDQLPERIICYNSGVCLTTEGSPVIADLKELEKKGTEIYSCGACLDFYDLTEKVAVGEVTNMYHIVEMLRHSVTILKP